ncbi:MAG: hypothetical protein IJ566_03125 [Cardiobacteriaceae bacterium]|nr:hypothetical protein [Cardiobacteriaceae bacterium]
MKWYLLLICEVTGIVDTAISVFLWQKEIQSKKIIMPVAVRYRCPSQGAKKMPQDCGSKNHHEAM